jgi:hypothetical protein
LHGKTEIKTAGHRNGLSHNVGQLRPVRVSIHCGYDFTVYRHLRSSRPNEFRLLGAGLAAYRCVSRGIPSEIVIALQR